MGAKKIKRVVVDTHVVISALLFKGLPSEINRLWKNKQIQPLCTTKIIEEYLRVLAYPRFQLTEEEISFLLHQEILPYFETLKVQTQKSFIKDDPSVDKFVWCAIDGHADMIISGDNHLLSFTQSPIPIVSVSHFLKHN